LNAAEAANPSSGNQEEDYRALQALNYLNEVSLINGCGVWHMISEFYFENYYGYFRNNLRTYIN
jgi:hypothetical protein